MQVVDTYPLPGHGQGMTVAWTSGIWQGMPVTPPISGFQFLKLACKCHGPAMHLHLHWDLNAFQGFDMIHSFTIFLFSVVVHVDVLIL